MIKDINEVNTMYKSIVPIEFRTKLYDVTKYPTIHGYNLVTSFRNGGKTTMILLWALCANYLYGSHISYMRTDKTMVTVSKVKTLFDTINAYTFDDGRNYIQHIYNDKYNRIYYLSREKRFVLACENSTDTEIKNAPTICYVHSIDQNDTLRSGFADSMLDIILYDEMVDSYINNNTFINFLHIVSTFFRLRTNSIIFLACNMSTGNPHILQQMGIYNNVLNQTTPYMMYTTENNTRIAVEILEVTDSISNERELMNDKFFGFKLDGIDIIRGSSITHETYRTIPADTSYELTDTNVVINACGANIKIYSLSTETYQPMYYARIISNTPENCITLTDDKNRAFQTPFTYASIGKDFPECISIAKAVRRSDVCYENYMTYICVKSFYDFYKVPDLL